MTNKPGPAQVQGSKIAKGHQSFRVFSSTALKTFFEKSLTTPKKLKGGTLWDFSISSLSQNPKKIEGGPFGKFFFRKNLAMPKNKLKGGTLWSRPALYVMRETFWFCSLGQQVKFEIL